MAKEALTTLTVEASADLSASQYTFQTVDSSNQIAVTGAGLTSDGVLQDKPTAQGQAASIGILGRSKIKLGGTVAAAIDVTADSTGRAVAAATGDYIMGRLTIGGDADEIGEMIINLMGVSD